MKSKRIQYGLGSWLGDNASDLLKSGAGAALTATGVGAPIGIGLMASGASGLAANNLTEDPNAQAALRTTGSIAGMVGGSGLLSFAMGGNTQLSEINNGGTHEQNSMGGVPMGPNASVEQGETKWQDYIFSDRLMTGNKKETFADASKKIQKKYPRENDTPSQKALEREMNSLMAQQEALRESQGLTRGEQLSLGGRVKAAHGLDLNQFNALNQTLNPNLGVLNPAGAGVSPMTDSIGRTYTESPTQGAESFNLADIEAEANQAVAAQNAINEQARIAAEAKIGADSPYNGLGSLQPGNTVTRNFSSDPTSSYNLSRTETLNQEHPSFISNEGTPSPASSTAKTGDTTTTSPESNYVTGPGAGAPGKGLKSFDKYDAIAMGAQLLPAMYNIGMGLKKPDTVNLGRMTPRTVDYSASRKATEDAFNQQANILNEAIRENATSSGQALSNRVAFANRAALDKANQLGQIDERQYNTNQQIRGNADQVNLQILANEEQINAQNKGIGQTALNLGLVQTAGILRGSNKDRKLNRVEQESIGMLGEGTDFTYELIPGTNSYRKVHRGSSTNTTKVG